MPTFQTPLNPTPIPEDDLWEVMLNALCHLEATGAQSEVQEIRDTAAKTEVMARVKRLVDYAFTRVSLSQFMARRTNSGTLVKVYAQTPEQGERHPIILVKGMPTLAELGCEATVMPSSELNMVLRYLTEVTQLQIEVQAEWQK